MGLESPRVGRREQPKELSKESDGMLNPGLHSVPGTGSLK